MQRHRIWRNVSRWHSSVKRSANGISRTAVIAGTLFSTACAVPGGNPAKLVPLPPVDPENAVELNIRSKFNSTRIQHHHILRVDGARVGLYLESDRDTLLLSPGKHTLGLSCHTHNTLANSFDVNYRVSDGDARLDIEAEAGESLCIGIGYKLLDCAVLELRSSDHCK